VFQITAYCTSRFPAHLRSHFWIASGIHVYRGSSAPPMTGHVYESYRKSVTVIGEGFSQDSIRLRVRLITMPQGPQGATNSMRAKAAYEVLYQQLFGELRIFGKEVCQTAFLPSAPVLRVLLIDVCDSHWPTSINSLEVASADSLATIGLDNRAGLARRCFKV
jgi:hypothetical protein